MAVATKPIYPQTVKNSILQLNNASSTTPVLLYTAGANGSKIELINVTSTDTSARNLILYCTSATPVNYQVGMVSIPITAGTINSTPSVNYLQNNSQMPYLPKDSNGNNYIFLKSGTFLYAAAATAITSTKVITIFVWAGDF